MKEYLNMGRGRTTPTAPTAGRRATWLYPQNQFLVSMSVSTNENIYLNPYKHMISAKWRPQSSFLGAAAPLVGWRDEMREHGVKARGQRRKRIVLMFSDLRGGVLVLQPLGREHGREHESDGSHAGCYELERVT